jgi:hypothetical protein
MMAVGDDEELKAMGEVQRVLGNLEPATASRVARWVADRYRAGPSARPLGRTAGPGPDGEEINGVGDLATVYEAANPTTTRERVMVVTYWFQVAQGQSNVDSQRINTELKQLGHGLKNITSAFTELIRERPQLVIQVRKAGSTRQARKRYRLTTEGIKRVKALMTSGSIDE